jgi:hypothetical protein
MFRILLCALLCLPEIVLADSLVFPGRPPFSPHKIAGFDVNAYAAGSYNYLSQSPYFTSGTFARLYDINPNGFTLQQAGLSIDKLPEQGLGGFISFMLGRDTYNTAPYGMPPALDSQNAGLLMTQAYLQSAMKSVTFMGGLLNTIEGYEPTISPPNHTFSNSLIATYLQPGTVTGFRATYAVNPRLNLIAGINNGWDNIRDWSRRKTSEIGFTFEEKNFSFLGSWYNGQERATPYTSTGPEGIRNLIDFVTTFKVTDKLTLAANYDFVTQNTAALPDDELGRGTVQGIAGYVLYQFNNRWRTAIRAEYFSDRNGFATDIPQNIKEMTVTVGYLVCKNFELRAETRRDIASTNSFRSKNGESTSNNLQSFALEGVWVI